VTLLNRTDGMVSDQVARIRADAKREGWSAVF
jgi:hypothetical protein